MLVTNETTKHHKAMSSREIGIDHTGEWTPGQYAIDAGWDFTCIEATARLGVSEADAAGLTEHQVAELLDFCKNRVSDRQK